MGRLNLANSNPIQDGINAYTSLASSFRADDADKLAAKQDERSAITQKLQQESAQQQITAHNNAQIDQQLEGVRYKVSQNVPLSADDQALLDKHVSVDTGKVVQAVNTELPIQSMLANAKGAASKLQTDASAIDTGVGPHKAKADQSVISLEARRAVLNSGLDTVAQGGVPTIEQTQAMLRETVANPAISDHNFASQYNSINKILALSKQVGNLKGPTKITDEATLADFSTANPTFVNKSNLGTPENPAKITSIYITPPPDGDPAKAMIVVGISGLNEKGEMVNGVVTTNRSSDPGDNIVQLSNGELSSQLERKKLLLDGIKSTQIYYGNKVIGPMYDKEQQARNASGAIAAAAETMKPGPGQDEMRLAAHLTATGQMSLEQGMSIAEKAKKPEAAAAAAESAIKLSKVKHDQGMELHAADRISTEKVAAGNNRTTLEAAIIHASAANKAGVNATSALLQQANWLIDKKIANTPAEAWDMVKEGINNPAKSLEIYTSSALKARAASPYVKPGDVGYVSDEDIAKSALAFSNSVQTSRSQATPTPGATAVPAVPPANRPPLSSFKH